MRKKLLNIFFVLSIIFLFSCHFGGVAFSESLGDTIDDQLNNIDLSELSRFLSDSVSGYDFFSMIKQLLNGQMSLSFSEVFNYILKAFFGKTYEILPALVSVLAISVFCGIINSAKGTFLSDGLEDIIFLVCFLSVVLILSGSVFVLYNETKNTIENITNLLEILSPIILTLMVASGGNVAAGIYKPAVGFLTGAVSEIISYVVLPLVGVMTVFNVYNCISKTARLKKYSDFCASVIKWILGIVATVFGVFITVQGIAGATYDGISVKAAKFAISNSIPIVGGLLKDGFDIVVAGSVLIKNSIGIVGIFAVFYLIVPNVLHMISFSLVLKLAAAIIEPITDPRLSDFCAQASKSITYFITTVLLCGLMLFVTVLLMIFSANAFIV